MSHDHAAARPADAAAQGPHDHPHDAHAQDEHAHDEHAHDDHAHDDHGHGHEHPAGWRGLVHGVAGAFGGHSHDASDKVDSAMETSREGMRALWVSLAALGVTAALQVVVVVVSHSVALLGDTLHNAADALTAIPLAVAFTLGRRAANRRYTYGYGRAEDLAGVVIVVIIALSAVLAAYESLRRLADPQPVHVLWAVALAGLIGFAGNEWVARYRITVGRRIGSAALVADGLHARTDGFTSLAVVVGAAGVAVGWSWADPVIGLLITVAIVFVLRDAAREVYHRLMDAVDPGLVDQAEQLLMAVPQVQGVERVRLRWIGHELHADADVTLDGALTLQEAHDVVVVAERRLRDGIARLSGAVIHPDPHGDAGRGAHGFGH